MRLNTDDFSLLSDLADFVEYYERLSPDDLMGELDRLYTEKSAQVLLNQYFSFLVTAIDVSCNNQNLLEHQRSAMIGVCGEVRRNIYDTIIPMLPKERKEAVYNALAAAEDRMIRFGFYPRAVDMMLVQAYKPSGPYVLGVVGEILARR